MNPLSISEFIASDVVRRLQQDRNRLITCSVIIILNCIARLILEILHIIHHIRDYFLHVINYMEGVLYVATIIFVSNFQPHCLPSWQWQLGAICIFLSWINFILFLSEQPAVGIYVVMFQNIMKTFLRIAPMAILLVLAFGQPFFMLLSVVEIEVSVYTCKLNVRMYIQWRQNAFSVHTILHLLPNVDTSSVVSGTTI